MGKKILSVMMSLLMAVSFAANGMVAAFAEEIPLKITKQPEDVFGTVDATLFTTVEAEGEGLTYEWFVKDPSSSNFVKSALKSPRYIFQMVESKVGRQVYCIITDENGNSVQSDTVTFRASYLKIIKQPNNMGGAEGEIVSTSVTAEGEELYYEWYFRNANSAEFVLSETEGAVYSFTLNPETTGREVYCVVTDKSGNSIRTEVVVAEISSPLFITKQPENVYGKAGAKFITTVSAEGTELSYEWFVKDVGASGFKKSAIKTARYICNLAAEKSGRQVYCVITDKYGHSVQSEIAEFHISNLKITEEPKNIGGAEGETVSTFVKVEGEGLSYKWYFKDTTDSEFTLSDVEGSVYSLVLTPEVSGREVYCVVSDETGNSVRTKTVLFDITEPLSITKQPENTFGADGANVFTTIEASGEGLTYEWYIKDVGSDKVVKSGIKSERYIFTLTQEKSGREVYCIVTDKYGRSVKSETAVFRISSLKIITQPPHAGGVIGGNVETTVIAEGEGLTYTWYVKDVDKTSFSKSSLKTNRYIFTMTAEKSGRQVYCVITDKYGNSVKSNIAVLGVDADLKILEQPKSAEMSEGLNATATVKAQGIELKYAWYVKDVGSEEFVKSVITSNRYIFQISKKTDGRQVYCVITDSNGKSVTTNTVTFSLVDSLKIIKQPTDIGGAVGETVSTTVVAEGEDLIYRWYFKDVGKEEFIPSTITEPTYKVDMNSARDGRQLYCLITDKFGRTVKTDIVVIGIYNYYISIDLGNGETLLGGASSEGKYTLKDPKRLGQTFIGWVDSEGNDFASSGIIDKNISIKAKWEVDGTDTLEKLIYLTNEGADTIKITGNIVVDRPIYISYKTRIYADEDYTILRAPDYDGDIFVVGHDDRERSSVMLHRKAVLSLGGGKGTLTIDGNSDNLAVTVVGSALYVSDSATLNLYDGVCISNHKKLGNKRIFNCEEYTPAYIIERVGGAAIININATVNIYGGVIENNEVCTEGVTETDETGADVWKEYNGCGGGVYNRGNLNMFGGTIRGNKALRGGGIYNDRIVKLESGTISDNYSYTYGGALSSSSSSDADIFIGKEGEGDSMLFKNNFSLRAGGAIYSSTTSPIIIYGNTVFEGNSTDSSGGAIYTAGTITAHNTIFRGNNSRLSGGAIYHHYSNPDYLQRIITLSDCRFETNSASLGGAITVSGAEATSVLEKGAKVNITNCDFDENSAIANSSNPGNGGAIYVTRFAELLLSGCNFENNTAQSTAGAVSVHSGADVDFVNCNFTANSARNGGAVYLSSDIKSSFKKINFVGNSAIVNANGGAGNGGAVYILTAPSVAENLTFKDNSAETNGGAIYLNACALSLGADSSFEENSAQGHGGAVYLTYQKLEDDTKVGSVFTANGVLFKNNTASAGGAVSVRSECSLIMNNAVLNGNHATGIKNDAEGGGAVYVGYGTLTLENVIASDNNSDGYGGVINAVGAEVTVTGGSYENNNALSGGALNAHQNTSVLVNGSKFLNNESTYENKEYNTNIGGGAININGGSITVSNTGFESNKTGYYGGTILADGTAVIINGNTVIKASSGGTGGALYFKGGCNAELEDIVLTDNISTANGVVYINGGTVNVERITASGNKGGNGGIFYISGKTYVTVTDGEISENNASNGGVAYITGAATLTLDGVNLTENTAKYGGAIYNQIATVNLVDATFTKNSSTGNGGAIYIAGGTAIADGECEFDENAAVGHGGAIYVSYYTNEDETRTYGMVNITDGEFAANTAMGGGAVSIRSGCEAIFDKTVFTENSVDGYADENDGDGEGGGAIYVGFASVTLNNVTANKNTSYYGGVIDSISSTVNITGGAFDQNNASSGGVIYAISNSKVNITDANMSQNESTDKTVEGKIGGGVVNISGGTLKISGGTFDGNRTGYYGGVVNAQGTTVTIEENSVIKNSAGATGAALYFRDGSKATIRDISVIENTSSGNGVVYSNGGTLNITNLIANGNKAYAGGVVFVSGGTTNLTNAEVSNNSATIGGAVQASGSAKVTIAGGSYSLNTASTGGVVQASGNANVTVSGGSYTLNTASSNGGAIYLTDSAKVTINDGIFNENSAKMGGAIYNHGATLTLINAELSTNTASSNGGAIYISAGNTTVSGESLFTQNSAIGHGGAVYVSYLTNEDNSKNPGIFNMTDGLFLENSAASGGAISSRTSCQVTLTNTELKGNTASSTETSGGGGAIFTNNNILTLSGVTLDGNASGYYGGAVFSSAAEITIKDESVIKNSVGTTGSALSLRDGSTVLISDVTIANNVITSGVSSGSGVIYINGKGSLTVTGLTASGNKNNNGGVIYASENANVTICDSQFKNNSANNLGGAIDYRAKGILLIENTVFESNSAKNGGAIYTTGKAIIKQSSFTGNSATVSGGAIHATNSAKVTVSEDCLFNTNTASTAGAVYLDLGAEASIADSSFAGNSATASGGVIHATNAAKATISENCEFNTNTAKIGGAIHLDLGAEVSIADSSFEGNKATGGDGGAIFVADSSEDGSSVTKLTLDSVEFKSNTASSKGGAISTDTASPELVIRALDCTFNANKALGAGGGAIEVQNGNCNSAVDPVEVKLVFTSCTFIGNTCSTTGAAIEIRTNSCAKIDSITATNNKASGVGGVIYVTSNYSRLYITGDVTQSNNTASDNSFINLYNNKYECPPKIYTTHSSSAAWYSLVKGNKTNIAFNLTELP